MSAIVCMHAAVDTLHTACRFSWMWPVVFANRRQTLRSRRLPRTAGTFIRLTTPHSKAVSRAPLQGVCGAAGRLSAPSRWQQCPRERSFRASCPSSSKACRLLLAGLVSKHCRTFSLVRPVRCRTLSERRDSSGKRISRRERFLHGCSPRSISKEQASMRMQRAPQLF